MTASAPVIVCIPAHDEAARIARLLASLAAQTGFDEDRRLPVLLFANNCGDATEPVARDFADTRAGAALDLAVVAAGLPPGEAHVGVARRTAMELACARIGNAPEGVLLSTDADAWLPPEWVASNLAALRGAEIVGGRLVIDVERPDPALARLNGDIERYWRGVRAIEERLDPQEHDPAPRHGDHTGASLALRVATYRAVGGLPPLPRGEDNALVARVQEAGGRLRHDPAVCVHVSDRRDGRAAGGMASEMVRRQAVLEGRDGYLLPSPAHWRRIVTRRAALRRLWRNGPEAIATALPGLGLSHEGLALQTCPNDIAFVERAHRLLDAQDGSAPLVPLADALRDLEAAPR